MRRFIRMLAINPRIKKSAKKEGKFSPLKALKAKFSTLKIFMDRLDKAAYGVIGLGDYQRYLEHFRATHPDKKPLSQAEFFRQSQDDKSKNVKC